MIDINRGGLRISYENDSAKTQRYMDADLLSALMIMGRDGRCGREALAEKVGVGYGSIRSILKTLSASGLIDIYRTGSVLNATGKKFTDTCPISLADCTLPECSVGGVQAAVKVIDSAESITNGMLQRDCGIYAGGLGCTTVVYRNGRLLMPPDTDISEMYPESAKEIIKSAKPSEGDVIIFGEGKDKSSALRAAMVAAMRSLGEKKL